MKTQSTALLTGVLSLLGLAREASAQETPEYMRVAIESIVGTGCPAGSVDAEVTNDNTLMQIRFSEYNVLAEDLHKFCNVILRAQFPAGWSFTLAQAKYLGIASLGTNAEAVFLTRYWFPGRSTSSNETRLRGPLFRGFEQNDELGIVAYSQCGPGEAVLNLQTDVGLARPSSNDYVNLEDQDFFINYTVVWRRCR